MTRSAGLPAYDGLEVPPLVAAAVVAARSSAFPLACTPETGRLLQLLAAHLVGGRIGELGTGCGVGTAWLASGMQAGSNLVTVELEPARAAIGRSLFRDRQDVEVLTGDWRLAAPHGPFDLLFSDGGPKREADAPDRLGPMLRTGGLLVLDDYTPESAWTKAQRALWADDSSRTIWLDNPRWSALELQVAPQMSVILAVWLG